MPAVRLQKVLAQAGLASRRKAEEFIRAGRVTVNGEIITELGSKVDPSTDLVLVDGQSLYAENKRLFLFYKPRGIISTLSDPDGRPCLKDAVRSLSVRAFSVGRLDQDVSGLLLLTNDGDFAERLLHPRYGVRRVYWARVSGRVDPRSVQRLVEGIELEDGLGKASAARVLKPDSQIRRLFEPSDEGTFVEVTVTVGRKYFVKRLLAGWGHPVLELIRVQFGEYRLGDLHPGEIREVRYRD